jgi:hypothetical protein
MSILRISGDTLVTEEWDVEEILKPIKEQVETIELFEINDRKPFHWYQQGMALEKR